MFRFLVENLLTLQDLAEAGAETRKQLFAESVKIQCLRRMMDILSSLCSASFDMRTASSTE